MASSFRIHAVLMRYIRQPMSTACPSDEFVWLMSPECSEDIAWGYAEQIVI